MTYQDRVLARVSEGETHTRELIGQHGQLFDSTIESMLAPYRALRAVVEIHGEDGNGNCKVCWYPGGTIREDFPCPTFRAIGKELGVSDDAE